MRFRPSALFVLLIIPLAGTAQTAPGASVPPRSWVDKDTGHRIWRLTDEGNSGGLYFNLNACTPDGRQMAYTAPDGIHLLNLQTRISRLLVANPEGKGAVPVRALLMGHKTSSLFYAQTDPSTGAISVYKINIGSGAIRKLAELPAQWKVDTVNADESLAAGTYLVGDATGKEYGSNLPAPASRDADAHAAAQAQGPNFQPANKPAMMEARLAARLPLVLFTIRLEPGPRGEKIGEIRTLLHSTDWVNHLLFSPTDPDLLLYCHEGPWQKVDRIWMIRADGSGNRLIHKRTMLNEIAGHEFWGADGESIWYDWQFPKGEDFFLAGYDLKSGVRTAYHLQRNEWSIHFNVSSDGKLFCGDGSSPGRVARADDGEWIELFHPRMIPGGNGALNGPSFWQPGVFQAERLVNMAHHYYRQEPNVRFSPNNKLVLFTSNMFGPSYLFAVEVALAVHPSAAEVRSTPELARSFNPVEPPNGKNPAPTETKPAQE